MKTKKEIGKASKKAGDEFEKKVRYHWENLGWTVSKWQNQVDLGFNKLVASKPMFVFNPLLKRRILIRMGTGFPDFICIKRMGTKDGENYYGVIGVESKLTGELDKEEKDKAKWLIDHKIFGEIIVSSKDGKNIKDVEFK